MTMRLFAKRLSPGETLLAGVSILGLILTTVSNFMSSSRSVTALLLALGTIVVLAWMVVLITRKSYVIEGYPEVMRLLEDLARSARRSVWTTRTHGGEAEREAKYFELLAARVVDADSPLTDFRRIMRLDVSAEPRRHAWWLFERLSRYSAVQVRYFRGGGPKFDFMVVDGEIAVIGVPLPGGLGNLGGIVVRDRHAVRGVEAVFEDLWAECETLFIGSTTAIGREQHEERARFEKLLQQFANSPTDAAGISHDRVW